MLINILPLLLGIIGLVSCQAFEVVSENTPTPTQNSATPTPQPTPTPTPTSMSFQQFFQQKFGAVDLAKEGLLSLVTTVLHKNGTILYEGAFGWKNPQTREPTTLNTIFNLGGIACLYTSTAVMNAIEETSNKQPKLTLESGVDELFRNNHKRTVIENFIIGDSHNYAGYPVFLNQKPISLRHLVLHVAGLDGAATRGKITDFSKRRSLDDYLAFFGPRRVRKEDTIITWSNHGIAYAALAIESHLNVSYKDYLLSHILEPMELNNTYPMLTPELLNDPNLQSFSLDGNTTEPHFARQFYPSRDMYGTVADVREFAFMHFKQGKSRNNKRILNRETIIEMQDIVGFVPLVMNHPLLDHWGVGIGWQKGQYGDVPFLECEGMSRHWKNSVRLYPEHDLIHVTLSLSFKSRDSERYLRKVYRDFIEEFVSKTDCSPPAFVSKDGSCAVAPSFFSYHQPVGKELDDYVGYYIASDYPHTTWEKSSVYKSWLMNSDALFTMERDHFGLTDSRNGCYIAIAKNLFYRGQRTESGNCSLPYPLQTNALVGFRSFQAGVSESEPLYLIAGGSGGTGPYERIAELLRIRWDVILFSYLAFYGVVLFAIPVLAYLIIKKHKESQKDGIFIAVVLGTVAATCSTVCNITALAGLYVYWTVGTLIMNEQYWLPVLFSSLDLLAFVFWFLSVGSLLYLISKQAYKISSHEGKSTSRGNDDQFNRSQGSPNFFADLDWYSVSWMILLFLSCIVGLSLIFALLQWNLFGPSHII